MLIEFKFRNLLSFKDETRFLMTTVKSFKEHGKDNTIKTKKGFDLLKSAAVYGANGGGKSNFIVAIGAMSRFIFSSYRNSLLPEDKKEQLILSSFSFNSKSEKDNTMFEVSFLRDSEIFRYGFEINQTEVKKEWLFRKKDREVLLFNREENNHFEINSESFQEGEKYKNDVNLNVLFISHLAQNNQKVSKEIHSWFSNINVLSGLRENAYSKYTTKLLKTDLNFKKWATAALRYLEITKIEPGELEEKIITYHNKFDENNLLIEAVPFNIEFESTGTKKLIHLLGPIYDTIRNGRILFIDELDSSLHPNLTCGLIHFFHELNKNGSQLIFSAHDVTLLNKKLFRRDQIWFTRRDQFGVSQLYPMSDFSSSIVRSSSAFDKKYLKNVFGAADTIELTGLKENLYAS